MELMIFSRVNWLLVTEVNLTEIGHVRGVPFAIKVQNPQLVAVKGLQDPKLALSFISIPATSALAPWTARANHH